MGGNGSSEMVDSAVAAVSWEAVDVGGGRWYSGWRVGWRILFASVFSVA